jgi:hypothetical protein
MNTGKNSFRSGLACASDSGDIVGPEKGRLSGAEETFRRSLLARATTGDHLCHSPVIVSWRTCRMLGDAGVAVASQC